ncbi:MAG: hypothetical protein AAF799_16360 [Myxococcota bacterium]
MPTWFEQLFGFEELDYEDTAARFACQGSTLTSRVNGRSFEAGSFETPSVAELRARVATLGTAGARVRHVAIGDVLELHALPENRHAMFQVASQLNCLEFGGPNEIPEHGVTQYAFDPTQGPACSLAAGAATVVRNYFVPVDGVPGQRSDRQLDNSADLQRRLGSTDEFITVHNGYTFSDEARLDAMPAAIAATGREALIGAMRIGLQSRCQVTFARRFEEPESPTFVSQAFCSALSCGYNRLPISMWKPLATIVLDAAYEATLLAALAEVESGIGSGVVWLTFLGGGVFGNDDAWIAAAIRRAIQRVPDPRLDVRVAHYRSINEPLRAAVDQG